MQIRDRLWNELTQCKHHHVYSIRLIAYQRRVLNIFNIAILLFSSAGIMGWKIWNNFPVIACVIIAGISLLKLLSPHIVPSEKQIDRLDQVTDFYCEYYNKLEALWMDHYNERLNDEEAQKTFYLIKDTERKINPTVNQIVKSTNKRILKKADKETNDYFKQLFNASL